MQFFFFKFLFERIEDFINKHQRITNGRQSPLQEYQPNEDNGRYQKDPTKLSLIYQTFLLNVKGPLQIKV